MQALVFSRAILSSFLFIGSILILQQSNSLYKYIVFSFVVQILVSIYKGFDCFLYSSIIGNVAAVIVVYSIKCKSTLYIRNDVIRRSKSDDSFGAIIRRCKKRIAKSTSSNNSTVPINNSDKKASNNEHLTQCYDDPIIYCWHNFCIRLDTVLYRISIYKLIITLRNSIAKNNIVTSKGINNILIDFTATVRRFFRTPKEISNHHYHHHHNKTNCDGDNIASFINVPNDIHVLHSDLKDHTKYKFINPFVSSSSEFLYAIEPIFVGVVVIIIIYFCIDDVIFDTNFPSGILVSYLVWLALFLLNYAIYRPLLAELDIRFCSSCANISLQHQSQLVNDVRKSTRKYNNIINRSGDINVIDESKSMDTTIGHSHIYYHKQSLHYYDIRRKYFGICITVLFIVFTIVPTPLIYGDLCFIEKQEHLLFLIGFIANICVIYFY